MTTIDVTTRLIGGLCALGLVVCGCDRADSTAESPEETTARAASSDEGDEASAAAAGADLSIGDDDVWTARVGAPGAEGRVRIDCASSGLDEEGERRLAELVGSGAGDEAPVAYDPEAMPGSFRGVAEVEVLTPEGPRKLALARLERTVTIGAYYWLQTEPSERLSGAYWTLAAPVGTFPEG
ncbi:MAG: hypothetical protein ABEN55_04645, partial [Bradymonadaceae bacterium]